MKQNKPSLRKLTHFREDIRAFKVHKMMQDKNCAIKEGGSYLSHMRLFGTIFNKGTVDVPATRLYDIKTEEKETHGDRYFLSYP